jgi:hypothetical protein
VVLEVKSTSINSDAEPLVYYGAALRQLAA